MLPLLLSRIVCEDGIDGWGETCPFGRQYLPGYAEAVPSGIGVLSSAVLGQAAHEVDVVNLRMDGALRAHHYIKAAIDLACWDAFGKAVGLPVCELLGGRLEGSAPYIAGIPHRSVDEMADTLASYQAKGYRAFSTKIGAGVEKDRAILEAINDLRKPGESHLADANGGMTSAAALALISSLPGSGFIFEQPCRTYDECLRVRRHSTVPMMLDEVLIEVADFMKAIADGVLDGANLKVGRVGGLTRARRIRDICIEAGLQISVQETGSCEISRAAVAHLAQTVPIDLRHSVWSSHDTNAVAMATTDIIDEGDAMAAGSLPGLGVVPDLAKLGPPIEHHTL